MNFKQWFNENFNRTGAKLGLYSPIDDAMGQYPPLYASPIAADFITYYNIQYPNGKGLDDSNGIVHYGRDNNMKINKIVWKQFYHTKS